MITPNAHTPVGTVISYAGPLQDNPSHNHGFPAPGLAAYAYHLKRAGWLPCDGRTLPVAGYRELFRAIGFIHGRSGKGFFRLPDYRGRFLRGVNLDAKTDDGAFRDPDRESRDPGADGGWAGNAVGSVQEDALRKHWHFYDRAKAGRTGCRGQSRIQHKGKRRLKTLIRLKRKSRQQRHLCRPGDPGQKRLCPLSNQIRPPKMRCTPISPPRICPASLFNPLPRRRQCRLPYPFF